MTDWTSMIADVTVSDVSVIIGTIVTGVIGIITAVVGGVVKIRNGQRDADKERGANQASNNKKLEVIHELTNSNLSKINAALNTATEKIAGLERRLEERDVKITEQKVELAKIHPPAPALAAASPEPVPVVVIPDKPVPVVISEESRKKASTDSR